jgi:hypothetical protein
MPGKKDKRKTDPDNISSEPYSSIISQAVGKIRDEPYLFIIAITSLIIGFAVLASGMGSPDLRFAMFVIAIVAVLALLVILVNYLREAQALRAKTIERSKSVEEQRNEGPIPPTLASHSVEKPGGRRPDYAELPKISVSQTKRQSIVDALRNCQAIQDRDTRNAIVNDLRPEIRSSINRHAAESVDVHNIVRTCLNYEGGLVELVETVRLFEHDALSMQTLDQVLNEVRDNE